MTDIFICCEITWFHKLFDNIYQSYTYTKIQKLIYRSFHMQCRYILFKFSNDKSKVYVYVYIEVYVYR